jgi:hypothetical protein
VMMMASTPSLNASSRLVRTDRPPYESTDHRLSRRPAQATGGP